MKIPDFELVKRQIEVQLAEYAEALDAYRQWAEGYKEKNDRLEKRLSDIDRWNRICNDRL